MNAKRALRLRREVLTELRSGELVSVAGAARGEIVSKIPTHCYACPTLQYECESQDVTCLTFRCSLECAR